MKKRHGFAAAGWAKEVPPKAVGNRRRFTRHEFLSLSGMGAAALVLGAGQPKKGTILTAPVFSNYPFTLGVASGDPWPDGAVLWTRLAPDPLSGGGMPRRDVEVRWEVASDEEFSEVVRSGTNTATPEFAHSVHVEVGGLDPGRHYWYRFMAGNELSPTGRAKTAPGSEVDAMAFAFASCQYWEAGYYPAYRAMAEEELDLVLHLGDYIYEWEPMSGGPRMHNVDGGPTTLAGYRDRHALYKTDPDLQAAHAAHSWVAIPDDHEGDNNYVDLVAEYGQGIRSSAAREAAYQAYYEHMPLRRSSLPRGAQASLYRRFAYGNLAEFSVLDTRQYRAEVPCGYGLEAPCAAALDEAAAMTGPAQERWLLEGLGSSGARWNVIAQQTRMAEYAYEARKGKKRYDHDTWDGYVAARNRILSYLSNRRPSNPIVISGDLHSNWVCDLKADFRDENSKIVGTEFVGTSITSTLAKYWIKRYERARGENPHVRYFDGRPGGYVRCDLDGSRWRSDLKLAGSILDPASPVRTVASFVVEDGRPGATRV